MENLRGTRLEQKGLFQTIIVPYVRKSGGLNSTECWDGKESVDSRYTWMIKVKILLPFVEYQGEIETA